MEVFGGLMTMLGMVWFFLAVIWFITPFVIFAIKGKVDRSHQLLEQLDRRLTELELRLPPVNTAAATDPMNPPQGSNLTGPAGHPLADD